MTTATLATHHNSVTLVTHDSPVTLTHFSHFPPQNHSIYRGCPFWTPRCNSGAPPASPPPAKSPAKVRNQLLTIGLHNTLQNSGHAKGAPLRSTAAADCSRSKACSACIHSKYGKPQAHTQRTLHSAQNTHCMQPRLKLTTIVDTILQPIATHCSPLQT